MLKVTDIEIVLGRKNCGNPGRGYDMSQYAMYGENEGRILRDIKGTGDS
jgi:hypothetical protein